MVKKGRISVNEKPKIIGQFPFLNPYLTVEEQLEYNSSKENNTINQITVLLNQVQLLEQKSQLIKTLSSGEKQRLALISVLISENEFILADEPFSRMDSKNANNTLELYLNTINNDKFSLIMTSHNPKHFKHFNRIYFIKNLKLEEIK